ncbi:MAG: hypothetical protein HYZ07_02425 [Candidatus Harrisonbacteria bacterium]|nr:hypothetical protein [Candidatus Harrisonbacteria bacterium]MBI2406446.1 hypothetical protein [Candidatus Harrisonbacteria bacterium]MBI2604170.1 hypothetical protein [Candidatus Harrisonbacteria bacterium]MBI3114793.1 hypothetical protein [Candidatus Harrisonbacteria bacterium]
MKASTKRIISLFGTAAAFIAALLTYAFFLRPLYDSVNVMRGELAAKSQLYDAQQRIMAKVNDLLAQYQGKAKIQDTISTTLPFEPAASFVVAQLQAIASGNGVAMEELNTQLLPLDQPVVNIDGLKGIGRMRASAKLIGDYAGLKGFLQGVETNLRLMDLVEAKVETIPKNPAALVFSVLIDAYYQAGQ